MESENFLNTQHKFQPNSQERLTVQQKLQNKAREEVDKYNIWLNSNTVTDDTTLISDGVGELEVTFFSILEVAVSNPNSEIKKLYHSFIASLNLPGAVSNRRSSVTKFISVLNTNKRDNKEGITVLYNFINLMKEINKEIT